MAAVLGIAEHNSWAEFVVVAADGGAPAVRLRERVELVDPALPSNPYHHQALALPLAEAEVLVDQVTRSAVALTRAALARVQSAHGVTAVVLQESPFPRLPDALADVLASWTLTCAADGMLYREALADGAAALGMRVVRTPRKVDSIADAAAALGVPTERVATLVQDFGRVVGVPWRKEHRLAAAAAIGVLARDGAVRL